MRLGRWARYASLALVGVGVILFILAVVGGPAAGLALPLWIIVLGAVFILLVFTLAGQLMERDESGSVQ